MSAITSSVQQRDINVFEWISNFGQQSIRKIANALGISVGQVQRGIAALSKRDNHPESHYWETKEGYEWLQRLVFAVMLEFGFKGSQGADRMSAFFKRIHIDDRVGSSPTALRTKMKKMEACLIDYQHIQEQKQASSGSVREIIAGGDETFFREYMLMVLMDLGSGYILVEEDASDRSYETWLKKSEKALKKLNLRVLHFVSDRGKSLIKLALSGFNCKAGADIFHAQYDISKWIGTGIGRKISKATTQYKKTKNTLSHLEEKNAPKEKIELKRQELKDDETCLNKIKEERQTYSDSLRKISEIIHPFSTGNNASQTSSQVELALKEQSQEFKTIANNNDISDSKGRFKKYIKQIKDMASGIDSWWFWAVESLVGYGLGKEKQDWLLYTLLPVIYWYQQMEKSQNHKMKKVYRQAWKKALLIYESHSLTHKILDDEMEQWLSWTDWISGKFQRASSAIEGRNGYLSQMHHNGRGITAKRLKALTVIHNYDTKRRDGTTAAERLFDTEIPDLFDWLIEQMGDLPLPRKSRGCNSPNPLNLQIVSA
jgi:hypothetical protein